MGRSGMHDAKSSVNQEKEIEGFVTRHLLSAFDM